jgi:hypothetical protein
MSGLGANALSIIDNGLYDKNEKMEIPERGTHTVLAEFGTATNCPFCPSHEQFLYQVQGDYEIVTLPCSHYVWSAGYNQAIKDRLQELGITGFPASFWDGGYRKVTGGQSSVTALQNAYDKCANRTVADVDLELSVTWLGNAQIQVDITATNNQESDYNGHIHVYVLELISRWNNYDNQPFKDALLDCPINKDITLDPFKPVLSGPTIGKIGVSYEYTMTIGDYIWSDSFIWDGNDHGYGDITEDNIKVVAAVFTKGTKHVDQALGALPSEEKQTNPSGGQVFYWLEWGDETNTSWLGPYNSSDETKIAHIYYVNGTYEIIGKAKNLNDFESPWSNSIFMFIGNFAPDEPQISGPANGKMKTDIEFTFVANDPNDDDLHYTIKWGDGSSEDWFGPYNSGQEVKMTHSWKKEGTWVIEAKVKDIYGVESDWARFDISIPRTRQSLERLFKDFLQRFPSVSKLFETLLRY